jgi:hypothetical protein
MKEIICTSPMVIVDRQDSAAARFMEGEGTDTGLDCALTTTDTVAAFHGIRAIAIMMVAMVRRISEMT